MSDYRQTHVFASVGRPNQNVANPKAKDIDIVNMQKSKQKNDNLQHVQGGSPAAIRPRTGEIQVNARGELCLPPDR